MKKILFIFIVFTSCITEEKLGPVDIQGHRGARGLLPENTIPAFIRAVELGVNTLELDLVVTKDNQLLVSHEPFFSSEFCLDTLGKRVEEASSMRYNIYEMTYQETKSFDCGSIDHPRFPDQEKMIAFKPLLNEVFERVEKFTLEKNLPKVNYNIELKTQRKWDSIFHPVPVDFADLVYEEITENNLWDRVNIQSFDFRTLQYYNQQYPNVKLALLIENRLPWKENVDSLGFTPDIYSCDYQLLSPSNIYAIQQAGMQVVPWTINETEEMKKLIEWGVDGIITDYPDRALELIK